MKLWHKIATGSKIFKIWNGYHIQHLAQKKKRERERERLKDKLMASFSYTTISDWVTCLYWYMSHLCRFIYDIVFILKFLLQNVLSQQGSVNHKFFLTNLGDYIVTIHMSLSILEAFRVPHVIQKAIHVTPRTLSTPFSIYIQILAINFPFLFRALHLSYLLSTK